MSEDMEQVFLDKRRDLEEKILMIAEQEHDNDRLQAFLYTSDLSTESKSLQRLRKFAHELNSGAKYMLAVIDVVGCPVP